MNNSELLKHCIKYATLYALAGFGLFVILSFITDNPMGNISLLGTPVFIAFICYSQKNYRDQQLKGSITYGQAVQVGLYTVVFSSLMFCLLLYLYVGFLRPDIFNNYKQFTLDQFQKLSDMGIMSQLAEKSISEAEKLTPGAVVQGECLNKLLGGLIIVLISSAVFKKQEPINPSNDLI
ncbi:MAG: DUF4199 domain-containing protein [Bacteroidetes bacterium]|nr:DUF4199 domain-containing protein [Bacteroidota bacterium]